MSETKLIQLFQIEGDGLEDEGLKHGDFLEIIEAVEPLEGKVVVAKYKTQGMIIVRRYHRAGKLIKFTPFRVKAPDFTLPEHEVTILGIVKSWTRRFE